jgi:uncharacterized protein YlxW (UPF0749 family)
MLSVPPRGVQAPRWTVVSLGLVAGFLAFWLVQEIRVQALLLQTAAIQRGQTLSYLVGQATQQTAALQAQVDRLRRELAVAPEPAAVPRSLAALEAEAGLTAVSGPGVTVALADSPRPTYPGEPADYQLVHDQYVLHVVGILFGAGATAVAINGQRYVSRTAIFCAGPTIRVNGVVSGSPFVVSALGPPGPMLAALANDPDIQGWGQLVRIRYRAVTSLTVPPYRGAVAFHYARPAAGGGGVAPEAGTAARQGG